MTYQQALEYLDGFINYERWIQYQVQRDFSLERVERFLTRLGNPHRAYATVHVAGTKGKGSTSAFAASMLSCAGLRVGLYTSPHLNSFRERIQIGGIPILEEELVEVVERIRPFASGDLTYFEVTTACAFLHFAIKKVDAAVLEVGLGGRLDATNVVSPEVTAITPISFDHMPKLGMTLQAIAREKAGIIKPGVPVVVAPQERQVGDLLQETAQERNAPVHSVEEEVQWQGLRPSLEGTQVSFRTQRGVYPDLVIPLLGRHQVCNAATALRIVELLLGTVLPPEGRRVGEWGLSPSVVREGLEKTVWLGRCQWVEGAPSFLLDGAQNAASAKALRETVEELFPERDILLVVGTSLEKDLAGLASVWGPWAKQIFLTQASAPRSESPDRLEQLFRPFDGRGIRKTSSVDQALEWARAQAHVQDLIVVTGSLFVVAEALQALQPSHLSPLPQ